MFLIFGTKGYREILGVATLVCQYCGSPAAHRIEKHATKFSLFFIPLFQVSSRYVMQCAMCSAESQLERRDAEHLMQSMQSGQELR